MRPGRPGRWAALLLAVVVLMLGAFPAGAVQAGGVEVLEDSFSVDFPRSVTFRLVARVPAPVREVRLLMSFPGSPVLRYARPAVESQDPLTLTTVVPASGVNYLPPGTRVTYRYEFTLEDGRVLETPPAEIRYLDPRFRWLRGREGPLLLLWHGRSEEEGRQVLEAVRLRIDQVMRLLGLGQVQEITGVVYNSLAEARPAFPPESPTVVREGIFIGYAFADRRVFVGAYLSERLVAHETAHILLGDALGPYRLMVPAWVSEGLAGYAEDPTAPLRRAVPGSLPLREMNTVPVRPREVSAFYAKAEDVVRFLVARYGAENFRRFIGLLALGRDVDTALREVYGFGVDGLDDAWSGRAVPGALPVPAPGTDTPKPRLPPVTPGLVYAFFLTALVVFVLVVMGVQRLVRRSEPLDEEADDDPWVWR